MRVLTIFILALVVTAQHATAQANHQGAGSTPATAIEEIKALEEARNQAILHGDVAALDRMTADDYTFITLRGELRTKSDILKGFASGSFKYESRQISDLNVLAAQFRTERRMARITAARTGSPQFT